MSSPLGTFVKGSSDSALEGQRRVKRQHIVEKCTTSGLTASLEYARTSEFCKSDSTFHHLLTWTTSPCTDTAIPNSTFCPTEQSLVLVSSSSYTTPFVTHCIAWVTPVHHLWYHCCFKICDDFCNRVQTFSTSTKMHLFRSWCKVKRSQLCSAS